MVSKVEVYGDIHVQLSQHRSGARLNGGNALMVGGENTVVVDVVDNVMGDDILHDAVDDRNIGNVAGKG